MTDTNAATRISEVVDGYFAMWNETDPLRRHTVTSATWSHDASYIDPMFAAEGHEALDAVVTAMHERFPGYRFRLTGAIDLHHDRARWSWELAGPNGGPPVATTPGPFAFHFVVPVAEGDTRLEVTASIANWARPGLPSRSPMATNH